MIKTQSQMHRTDKYSKHSSIIRPVWLINWVFIYELSGCGFESSCRHLNFRDRACFEQGVSWHYETYTWHDEAFQNSTRHTNSDKLTCCHQILFFHAFVFVFCHLLFAKRICKTIPVQSQQFWIYRDWFFLGNIRLAHSRFLVYLSWISCSAMFQLFFLAVSCDFVSYCFCLVQIRFQKRIIEMVHK